MNRPTLSDKKMIDELESSREQLLSGARGDDLLRLLRRRLLSLTQNIYVLRWIPEQGEDLYDLLIDGVSVARVEIPRSNRSAEAKFETRPVEEYKKIESTLTKPERRRFELALRLARSRAAT
jgi:cobalamin biosynthesis Mg chelatase CobN